jgi:hypothetical protein
LTGAALDLHRRYALQEDTAQAHADAERRHSRELAKQTSRLRASRDGIRAALAAVEAAHVQLADATTEHTEALAAAHGAMSAAGLHAVDPVTGEIRDNGADPRGWVRAGGEWWAPLDPATAVGVAFHRGALAAYGARWHVVESLKHSAAAVAWRNRTDALAD